MKEKRIPTNIVRKWLSGEYPAKIVYVAFLLFGFMVGLQELLAGQGYEALLLFGMGVFLGLMAVAMFEIEDKERGIKS